MYQNTKLLVSASLFIIITGFGLLWFGLEPAIKPAFSPVADPVAEELPVVNLSDKPATSSAVIGIKGERAWVSKVVDGDTIEISTGKAVRFVGIDTPETVDPRRPVGCFGKEASNETKSLLSGKEVILQKDVSEEDKYGRLLRYVYLPLENGQLLFVNDYLVREGFAKVYTYPPDVRFNEQFREAEREAREGNRGLWGRC